MNDTLTCAIIGHLVGDYLLQNDWMALNKKKDAAICAVHCCLWATAICLIAGWELFGRAYSVLLLTHFIQDHTNIIAWWMRLIKQDKFAEPPMSPWSIIVVDNVWHIVTIWAVWRFVV